jgi:hypothetical protein
MNDKQQPTPEQTNAPTEEEIANGHVLIVTTVSQSHAVFAGGKMKTKWSYEHCSIRAEGVDFPCPLCETIVKAGVTHNCRKPKKMAPICGEEQSSYRHLEAK